MGANRKGNKMNLDYSVSQEETDRKGSRQADKLIQLAEAVRLFKTPEGELYAQFPIDGRWETHALKSAAVRHWLTLTYAEQYDSVPNKTALDTALSLLEARARFRGRVREVSVRVAWQDEALYLDLCNERGEVAKITAEGWEVTTDAPVLFTRSNSMLPLPAPERGGTLDELDTLLNLQDEKDRVLVKAWLIGALHPTGPYPVLALHGEKGTAKSTATRYLRMLIDPAKPATAKEPRDGERLAVYARNNYVTAFDNLSYIPPWLSDGLCRLATGAGDSTREMYTNGEQFIFYAKRPIILNGIEEIATAGDLLDRTITVNLTVIPETQRKTEEELDAAFERAQPRILGALLDAVSAALRNRGKVHLPSLPRMADFTVWVTAAEEAIGWQPLTFFRVYTGNREEASLSELEASPIGAAVLNLMEKHDEWTGTATDLLKELKNHAEDSATYHPRWPKNGNALSGKLVRLAGALRSQGIEFSRTHSTGRKITLRRNEDATNKRGRADEIRVTDAEDAEDAKIHTLPVSPFSEKRREEEIGNARKIASVASVASQPALRLVYSSDAKNTVASVASDEDETF